MVVSVMGGHVKTHAPVHLFQLCMVFGQQIGQLHQIMVIQVRDTVGGLQQSAHGHHVYLFPVDPVKTFRSEKAISQLGREKPDFRHSDLAGFRALVISIFFQPDGLSIIGGGEFYDPGFPVQLDQGFGPGAAGGSAQLEQQVQIVAVLFPQDLLTFHGKPVKVQLLLRVQMEQLRDIS